MKQMLQYLKAYKKESIIAPLFKMLEASFELLVPIVMANIIDVGIQNGDKPYIWRMCADDRTGCVGTGVFPDGAVFCCKGGDGIWNGTEKGTVWTHQQPEL